MPRKTKETKDVAPALPVSKELLDQLVTGPMTPEQFESMFRGLKKAVLERALGAELTHHLGTEKDQGAPRGNHRNGTTPKTVITDDGAVRLEVRRVGRAAGHHHLDPAGVDVVRMPVRAQLHDLVVQSHRGLA